MLGSACGLCHNQFAVAKANQTKKATRNPSRWLLLCIGLFLQQQQLKKSQFWLTSFTVTSDLAALNKGGEVSTETSRDFQQVRIRKRMRPKIRGHRKIMASPAL